MPSAFALLSLMLPRLYRRNTDWLSQ